MAEYKPVSYFIDAVADYLKAELVGLVVMNYSEMTEAIHDTPSLAVYPASGQTDVGPATDRTTFGAGVSQTRITVNADVFGQQRSVLGEDLSAMVEALDKMEQVLSEQETALFRVKEIKAMNWNWTTIVFEYGGQNKRYSGIRFVINLRIY